MGLLLLLLLLLLWLSVVFLGRFGLLLLLLILLLLLLLLLGLLLLLLLLLLLSLLLRSPQPVTLQCNLCCASCTRNQVTVHVLVNWDLWRLGGNRKLALKGSTGRLGIAI